MSYVRFSKESDVYMYWHVDGYVDCCGCSISESWALHSFKDALKHLHEHRKRGDKVPDYAIERIQREIKSGASPTDCLKECPKCKEQKLGWSMSSPQKEVHTCRACGERVVT